LIAVYRGCFEATDVITTLQNISFRRKCAWDVYLTRVDLSGFSFLLSLFCSLAFI